MRILVTGSRDWSDWKTIYRTLDDVTRRAGLWVEPDEHGNSMPTHEVVIIHGGCRSGADQWANDWAISSFLVPEVHEADWKRYGKAAGPVRNQQMVDAGADICLAFIKNNSRGATDCAKRAEDAGIEVVRLTA